MELPKGTARVPLANLIRGYVYGGSANWFSDDRDRDPEPPGRHRRPGPPDRGLPPPRPARRARPATSQT
jgi:hypothetical protein